MAGEAGSIPVPPFLIQVSPWTDVTEDGEAPGGAAFEQIACVTAAGKGPLEAGGPGDLGAEGATGSCSEKSRCLY